MATGPLGFARLLGARLNGLSRRRSGPRVEIADPWAIRGEPAAAPSIRLLLDEVEAAALSVYRSHGLPTQIGQYARSARSKAWKFVAEELNAEERWALFLANDSGKGWRFSSLEDLGLMEAGGSSELRKASDLLTACRTLRASLAGRGTTSRADDIETAIRLGSEWRMIELAVTRVRDGSLKLGKPRRGGKSRTPGAAR